MILKWVSQRSFAVFIPACLRCQARAASGVSEGQKGNKTPQWRTLIYWAVISSVHSFPLSDSASQTAPGIQQRYGLDISTQTHQGWLLGSDDTLPNGTQAEAKICDFLHHLKFRLSKTFSFLKLQTDTLLWTVMDKETWSTHGHWGQAAWQGILSKLSNFERVA